MYQLVKGSWQIPGTNLQVFKKTYMYDYVCRTPGVQDSFHETFPYFVSFCVYLGLT